MCDTILATLLKVRPHYSQSSRENATSSSGTSPLASCKEVLPPPGAFCAEKTEICRLAILLERNRRKVPGDKPQKKRKHSFRGLAAL